MINDALAGRRILVTGVTGFIGQLLFARLLADVPGCRIVVLVRRRGSTSGRQRLVQLLDKPVFTAARDEHGIEALQAAVDERVEVIEAELGGGELNLPDDLDIVFHCAATVSFDPPIDEGFTINLLGANQLYAAVRDSGSRAHLVHVSTAYVAGMRKGEVPEAPLDHDVDWRAELDAALAARVDVERASRRPDVLDRLGEAARAEHSRAGPQTIAAATERSRREWVSEQLVDYGRARAHSLGWPDVYTLTKALGERAVEGLAAEAGLPLSIVRPAIVESALAYPYPGWIEGFKMAEPLILAYGQGALPEFPAVPDGIVDLIPVDLVVNGMIAVAAAPAPEPVQPGYYHLSSGDRNPLTFHTLYQLISEYFRRHPLPDPDRGTVSVPQWQFPGRHRVEKMLQTGERLVELADKVVDVIPRSPRARKLATELHRQRRKVEFVRRYADLYGAYTAAEVLYRVDAAHNLHLALPPEDRERFGFDAGDFTWQYYLQDVHCPSVTQLLRIPRGASTGPPRSREPEPAAPGVLAVFDLEGTIVASNVVEAYVWTRLAELPPSAWPSELASVAKALPRYLSTDRRDRGDFLRAFYRRYEGATPEGLAELVDRHLSEVMLQRAAPAAIRRIRRHRAAGHRTILITGALEAFVVPLRPLFDEVVASQLAVGDDGRFTGYLSEPPLVGEARAAWLRRHADQIGADLRASAAYGDSHSDLPLLAAVGNPVAVNPDGGLYAAARRRTWPVEEWSHDPSTAKLHGLGGSEGWSGVAARLPIGSAGGAR